jgi:hypothetical protein
VLGLFLVLNLATAFWSTGHMTISRIVYEELKAKNATLLAEVERDIEILKEFSMEANHSFVESAVWADDNGEIGFNQFFNWHFSNNPIVAPDFEEEIYLEHKNVTWAIKEMIRTLEFVDKPKFNSGLAVSFAYRYLIHIVSDLHQPLHASSYYSKQFPDGDQGGNLILIKHENPQIKNLHSLWDSCIDVYGSIWAPLNQTEWELIGQQAKEITEMFPRERVAKRLNSTCADDWAAESFVLAKEVVYDGIRMNDFQTPEYIARAIPIVKEQLAVAAYRLADLIEKLALKRAGKKMDIYLKERMHL